MQYVVYSLHSPLCVGSIPNDSSYLIPKIFKHMNKPGLWVKHYRIPPPALLIISLEIFWYGIILLQPPDHQLHHCCWTGRVGEWEEILLHAHSQVLYYNCVKFHQYQFIHLGEVFTKVWTGWFQYNSSSFCIMNKEKETVIFLGYILFFYCSFKHGMKYNLL